ncbi:hypothetical protein HYDPIDRAFT_116502, partial [Hydnomerulius pinastri MD-312]
GGTAILLWDYCLTIPFEVEHVWGRKWEVTRVVFTVSRYLPFIASGMTCYAIKNRNDNNCLTFDTVSYILHAVGIIFAEALLLLRTWAMWQRSRKILISLLAVGSSFFVCALTLTTTVSVNTPSDTNSPFTNNPSGCQFQISRSYFFQYVFPMVFEIILQVMNSLKKFRDYRGVQSLALKTLYWDGMWYMFWIILVSVVNITLLTTAPIAYSDSMETYQLVIHSILACRIFFNLRETDRREHNGETESSIPLTTYSFRTQSPTQQPERVPVCSVHCRTVCASQPHPRR